MLKVTFDAAEVPPQTVHVKPHDTVEILGVSLKNTKIDLIGPDLIIADTTTGNKILFPGLGLFMFSVAEAPQFIFDSAPVSQDDLLGKIGFIVNITDKDYITYTSLALNQHEKVAPPDPELPQPKQDNSLLLQMLAKTKPELPDAPPPPPASEDAEEREALISNSVGQPPLPQISPSPPSQAIQTIKQLSARATFDFDTRLLQVQAVDDTSGPVRIYHGGGGSAGSGFSPAPAAQYSTEIIDTVSDTNPLEIHADNPGFIGAGLMSRMLQLSPNLPDGFDVDSVTISGLPAGFSIVGAVGGAGSFTINNPVIDSLGNINLVIQYTNLTPQSFTLNIVSTATFDPASGFEDPPSLTLDHDIDMPVVVRAVNMPADYVYVSGGQPGWVLATNPNNNKILAGDGGVTVHGGEGRDDILTGDGNDDVRGNGSNDIISTGQGDDALRGGRGNDTLQGGLGNDTADFSDTSDMLTADLSVVAGGYSTAYVGAAETDQMQGIENITGGSANDSITGDAGANVLDGGVGNDVLMGRAGNDTLVSGGGIDTADYSYAANGITIDLDAGSVNVGAGDLDTLVGIRNATGTAFDDTLVSSGAGNAMDGAGGTDTVSYAVAAAGVTVSLATGTASGDGADTLTSIENVTGSSFNDNITGDTGVNVIRGGAGGDTVNAGAGDDSVYGGLGGDGMDGGIGNDQLRFDDLAGTGVSVNLAAGTAFYATDGSTDTYSNFEAYYLTNQGDTLAGSAGADTAYGQDGNDTMAGAAGNDTLDAGTGNDVLDGGDGADALTGGAGNDTVYGGAGGDTLSGGADTDQLRFDDLAGGISLNLSAGTAFYATDGSTDNFGGFELYYLSNQADTLVGSAAGDTVYGLLGDDVMNGGAGNDVIDAGGGNDTVYATLGSDTMDGGLGVDQLRFDDLAGGPVSLNLAASTAFYAADGSTDSYSNFEAYYLSNQGDTLSGSAGDDTVYGQGGNDTLNGNNGNDTLDGGLGIDTISGGTGNDNLSGNDGDDIVYGGLGNDTLDGGLGNDQLRFDDLTGGGITFSLATSTATYAFDASSDGYSNFESYYLTNQADTLNGSAGADIVSGLGGNDTFNASTGNDSLDGGVGTDTVDYSAATGPMTVNLLANSATGMGTHTLMNMENITGSGFNDSLTGNNLANTISGGAGNDTLDGRAGNDTMDGGAGVNAVSYAYVPFNDLYMNMTSVDVNGYWQVTDWATGEVDLVRNVSVIYGGNSGYNLIYLNNTGVTVYTGTGYSEIYGGSGNDILDATLSGGWSYLSGGAGNDTLIGGANGEYFAPGLGSDTVTGRVSGYDYLDYSDIAGGGVTLNIGTSSAVDYAGGTDTFTSIEEYYLGSFNDTVYGSAGNDFVYDYGGVNIFYASLGNDLFYAWGVNDTIDFSGLGAGVTATLSTTNGSATSAGMSATLYSFEHVNGTAFNDTLTGSTAANIINGGNGDDTMVGQLGNDTMDGQAGNNTVDYTYTSAALTVNMGSVALGSFYAVAIGAETDQVRNVLTFIGGGGADTITGDAAVNALRGGNGNDTIDGGLGNDTLDGGGNTDTVTYQARVGITGVVASLAGGTAAVMNGVATVDTDTLVNFENITGSTFDDTLTGDGGNNALTGLTGNDSIDGGAGDDLVDGGAGDDALTGGAHGLAGDTVTYATASAFVVANLALGTATGTSTGNDTLAGFENITGSGFDDDLRGDGGANLIAGGAGADFLSGAGGNDTLNGEAGSDVMVGGAGDDVINGGGGYDIVSYASSTGAINVNLQTGAVSDGMGGNDTLAPTTIEEVVGSDYADTFRDGTLSETVRGGDNNDTFNDFDSSASDVIYGDNGTDTVNYNGTGGSVIGNLGAVGSVTFGTIQKAVDGTSDNIFTVERITTAGSNDTFTLDTNALLAFNNIDTAGGSDRINVNNGSGQTLTTTGIEGVTMASIFDNIEILDLRNATLTGADDFDLHSTDIYGMTSAASPTLRLQVKQGFLLDIISDHGIVSGAEATAENTSTIGSVNTITWNNGAYNVTLQVETVA